MTETEARKQPASAQLIRQIQSRFSQDRCNEDQQLLQTMANPIRFHILCALRIQPFTVTELVEIADANLSNVSQQLKMMWLAGYLAKEKTGKQVYYRMADERINSIVAFMEDLFSPTNDSGT